MRVRIIAGLLSALMLLVIMPAAWEDTSGAYVDKFMDGGSQASMEVVFKGTGSAVYDPSVFFEIDKNVPIA